MKEMQLDMFEVQLGASILLQFRTEKSIIRVLADAGILASDYPLDHVHKKLRPAINDFNNGEKELRLDLIIGTHYDADHLEGLVPIINDRQIDIGEAWMPPVANDTETYPSDASIENHQLLAYQFSQENADKKLYEYLKSKDQVCHEISQLQQDAYKILSEDQTFSRRRNQEYSKNNSLEFNRNFASKEVEQKLDTYISHFKQHVNESDAVIGHVDCSHANCEFDEEIGFITKETNLRGSWLSNRIHSKDARNAYFINKWSDAKDLINSDTISLAYIRRSAAKDAINATSLYKVVTALKQRNIRIVCHTIPDGKPRRFIWDEANKRFNPWQNLSSVGPELTLLGPSNGLVKKHQKRLPIGDYMMHLAFRSIPIKNITPSNQLSYVIRFEYKEQGILITGDAGFVDFKPKGKKAYYEEILNKLAPLHLIQVAHHAGRNAHFYQALLASQYPQQEENSLLLLSHATHDKFRPSDEFGLFIANLLKDGDDIKLLFTSEPRLDKVINFKGIIYPVTTTRDKVGDVQVIFNGQQWDVIKHSVAV